LYENFNARIRKVFINNRVEDMSTKTLFDETTKIVRCSDNRTIWMFTYISETNRTLKQKKTSIPSNLKTYLDDLYKWYNINFSHVHKHEDIDIKWTVEIYDTFKLDNLIYAIEEIRMLSPREYYNIFKYKNYNIKWLEWDSIILSTIDNLWNDSVTKIKIWKLIKYILEQPYSNRISTSKKNYLQSFKTWQSQKFKYKITNSITEKIKAVKANNSFWSCQRECYVKPREYAWWLYDFFNNACLIPLLVYNEDWNIIWRSAFRLYYDEEWKKYIHLERLYTTWILSNLIKPFAVELTKQLLNYSDNLTIAEKFTVTQTRATNPRHDALVASWLFKVEKIKWIFRQPLREKTEWIDCWYYHDTAWFVMNTVKNTLTNKLKYSNYIFDMITSNKDTLSSIKLK